MNQEQSGNTVIAQSNPAGVSFADFQLTKNIDRALEKLGFTSPTPIQAQAIPLGLQGHDLIACAQTGTGKTAAFCIPMMMSLIRSPGATALVLTPTRELAQQIHEFWKQLAGSDPMLRAACLIGGESFMHQRKALRANPRLVIATPGRLLDHLNQKTVNLSTVKILVLDEADRMLDMGFAPQLDRVAKYISNNRQTLMFTATWDTNLDRLAKKYLKDPKQISIGAVSKAAPTIEQKVISTTRDKKFDLLMDELNQMDSSVLIFSSTQSRTDRLARDLSQSGYDVVRMHGGRSQSQRNGALNAFRDGTVKIMIATDIAARGIDVPEIGFVVNYDLPRAAEDYIHRIGRTGRAGRAGLAMSFVLPEDRSQWHQITKLLKKTGSSQPTGDVPELARTHGSRDEHSNQGRRPSGRPSGNRPSGRPAGRPTPSPSGSARPFFKPSEDRRTLVSPSFSSPRI